MACSRVKFTLQVVVANSYTLGRRTPHSLSAFQVSLYHNCTVWSYRTFEKEMSLLMWMGRDSSVGIATCYGLDCPGIESQWGRDFPHLSIPTLGAHPASYTVGTVSFPGVKRPGRGVDHPPPSSAKVKERVELYHYSLFGPSWPFRCAIPVVLYRITNIR